MDHHNMDHGSMDHGMDHSNMDHGSHHTDMSTSAVHPRAHDHGSMNMNGSSHMGMAMNMWFMTMTSGNVLFKEWKFDSVGGLIASMVGIFFMAAIYEGLKYYREYLFWKTYNALQYRAVSIPEKDVVGTEDNQVVHVVSEVIHKQPPTMWSQMHFFQTFLHMVQMVLSYFLMLIFMTYNVYLCIAVVLGAGVGYFLFGWKKSVIVDVTEHCH